MTPSAATASLGRIQLGPGSAYDVAIQANGGSWPSGTQAEASVHGSRYRSDGRLDGRSAIAAWFDRAEMGARAPSRSSSTARSS
jgi:hypothetical protein